MKLIALNPKIADKNGTTYLYAEIPREHIKVLRAHLEQVGEKITLEIKKWFQKRSRDSNAYAWVLIDKIAVARGGATTPTDVYRELIHDVGGNSDIYLMQNKAIPKFRATWESNGLGWLIDITGSHYEDCSNVVVYFGSSTFDQQQMTRFIELIVQECHQYDIETLTPAELALMNEEWGKHYAKKNATQNKDTSQIQDRV